uniref:Inositol 1,4,5-trisphosphate/ryanodine receptor domain-containing protein n=1 Tax=Xiphophorus maculatus TaxID=8083 RepID=A0A3B5R6Z9_XIPMA
CCREACCSSPFGRYRNIIGINTPVSPWQDDEVVLQSVATIQKEHRKFCLAAEGLGNRLCYLEPTSEAKYVPPDMCICNFVLEQSLSVRALQEMLANTGASSEGAGQGGGHRTLLYGHAILLRHSFSDMVSIYTPITKMEINCTLIIVRHSVTEVVELLLKKIIIIKY